MNNRLQAIAAAAFVLSVFCCCCPEAPLNASQTEGQDSAEVDLPNYERLRSDAAWCGPRLLYFFSVYMGKERSLSEVVGLCAADSSGFVTLESIVRAATAMGLEPVAMHCSPDDILGSGGPALVVVNTGNLHLLGFLGCDGHECVIIDPSQPSRVFRRPREEVVKELGDAVVFLKGARIPETTILTWEHSSLLIGFASLILACLLWFSRSKTQ